MTSAAPPITTASNKIRAIVELVACSAALDPAMMAPVEEPCIIDRVLLFLRKKRIESIRRKRRSLSGIFYKGLGEKLISRHTTASKIGR